MSPALRFPVFILVSLVAFLAILRFVTRSRPARPPAAVLLGVAGVVVVGGMVFAKLGQNATYAVGPGLAAGHLPRVEEPRAAQRVETFSGWRKTWDLGVVGAFLGNARDQVVPDFDLIASGSFSASGRGEVLQYRRSNGAVEVLGLGASGRARVVGTAALPTSIDFLVVGGCAGNGCGPTWTTPTAASGRAGRP